jgi:hypothetical protein
MMDAALGVLQRAPEPHEVPAQRCSLAEVDRFRPYALGLAAQAPPLTAEQRARLVALLHLPAANRGDVSGGAA